MFLIHQLLKEYRKEKRTEGKKKEGKLANIKHPIICQIVKSKLLVFPCGLVGKESACNVEDLGSNPGLGRTPGEGKGYLPTPVFWPGEFHGQSMELQRVGHD